MQVSTTIRHRVLIDASVQSADVPERSWEQASPDFEHS